MVTPGVLPAIDDRRRTLLPPGDDMKVNLLLSLDKNLISANESASPSIGPSHNRCGQLRHSDRGPTRIRDSDAEFRCKKLSRQTRHAQRQEVGKTLGGSHDALEVQGFVGGNHYQSCNIEALGLKRLRKESEKQIRWPLKSPRDDEIKRLTAITEVMP